VAWPGLGLRAVDFTGRLTQRCRESILMRVLSIDPAVRNTGYAVLEGDPRRPVVLAFDVISVPAHLPQSTALAAIRGHLANVIAKYQPDEVAVEGIIYVQSHRTAISMGAARAAALIAAADGGLPIYEYAPRKVKMAVVGKGNADKQQVAFMVRALLGLAETPPSDAADALAIGMAHLQASDPLKAKLLDRRVV
jgi:crossover junction endodeoxyribonuclease RuvC